MSDILKNFLQRGINAQKAVDEILAEAREDDLLLEVDDKLYSEKRVIVSFANKKMYPVLIRKDDGTSMNVSWKDYKAANLKDTTPSADQTKFIKAVRDQATLSIQEVFDYEAFAKKNPSFVKHIDYFVTKYKVAITTTGLKQA